MKIVTGTVRTNKEGSECNFETWVEDNATQEEIDEAVRESALEYVDYWVDEIVTDEG